ncbi:MAG TPA: YqaA family protein [Phycisphaerae bacterium]|nr:YqaA family protein [Phycisphaerae bacterium]
MDCTQPTNDPPAQSATPQKRPHLLRRLYYWVLHWAHTPYGGIALFLLAFTESSFFPIPPDPLLMALAMGNRRKAFRYATLCSVASILGGLLGFVIGYFLMNLVGRPIIDFYNAQDVFNKVVAQLEEGINLYVFVAAFTPIPYKVFTIAAGVVAESQDANVWTFLVGFTLASAVGRAGRFFLVAALLYWFGEAARRFIDKYFEWLALACGALLVAGFFVVKYAMGK